MPPDAIVSLAVLSGQHLQQVSYTAPVQRFVPQSRQPAESLPPNWRPETVRVEPNATVRFELSADEYFVDGSFEIESARAHRIVTQPSHGSLDVGDTVTVIIDGATHQVFADEWVTYAPDPGYAGVDSFTFVALDELRPGYPINPVVARVTLDISGLDATVTIDNAPAGVATGSSFDLDATVNGATNDVTWSVDGVEGGSDEAGASDADGRYSAPVVPPVSVTVTVRAASTQAPAAYAEVEIAVVEPAPASGKPIIEGIEEVDRTLTASTSEISVSNGVDTTTYSYQWIRNDGTADMDIPGATSSQYTLTTDDLGKTIAVRVSFTDDLGFPETLTSSHTSAVAVISNNAASGAPIINGLAMERTFIWTYRVSPMPTVSPTSPTATNGSPTTGPRTRTSQEPPPPHTPLGEAIITKGSP